MGNGSTPGPGGFGPTPAFSHLRSGVHLTPAKVSPRPGVYSGPHVSVAHHTWPWVTPAVVLVLVAVLVVSRRRQR
jgi:hypothetical protein